MYSWEKNVNDYKYESIQHGYEAIDYQEEEPLEISLDEMLELENEEEMEMELEEAF